MDFLTPLKFIASLLVGLNQLSSPSAPFPSDKSCSISGPTIYNCDAYNQLNFNLNVASDVNKALLKLENKQLFIQAFGCNEHAACYLVKDNEGKITARIIPYDHNN